MMANAIAYFDHVHAFFCFFGEMYVLFFFSFSFFIGLQQTLLL